MKSKISLAALALAAAALAMPVSAEAGFHRGVRKCDCLFAWMHRDHCRKVVVVKGKKRYAKKAAKAKKG